MTCLAEVVPNHQNLCIFFIIDHILLDENSAKVHWHCSTGLNPYIASYVLVLKVVVSVKVGMTTATICFFILGIVMFLVHEALASR